ncbi:hypothetical protein J5I95_17305 [Candidatus Poribacteria bacterium]|nr:hypothetical protein [Candidatus Poribacteria bacterium]
MSYSLDLRKCVLDFVNKGGSKVEAERTFGISRRTIYNWLEVCESASVSKKPGPKGPRHIAYNVLEKHVADFPDNTLAERAEHFGVSKGCISYTFEKLNKLYN